MSVEAGDPYSLTLFTAQSGALSARLDGNDGTARHLHSLVDPEKEADYHSDLQLWGDRIVLVGCGLGYHLKNAIVALKKPVPMLIVEFYEELADRTMAMFPAALRGGVATVTAITGHPRERIDTFIRGGGKVQFIRHPASFYAHPGFYRTVLQPFPPTVGGRRQATSMLLMQGDFFVERELAAAAGGCGTKVAVFRYKEQSSASGYESHLQHVLQDAHPEVIVSINMLGFDGNGILAEYASRAGIPVVVWFVDDPRPIVLNHENSGIRGMHVFTWERAYIPWLRQQGFASVGYLPLAADEHRCAGVIVDEYRYRCGFVGTSMGRRFLDEIAAKFIWRPEYAAVARQVAVHLQGQTGVDVDRQIDEELARQRFEAAHPDAHTRTWLRSYIIHFASMLRRKSIIDALRSSGIETFGDCNGWRELCGAWLTTHADIDYRTGIAACYRSIAVNLNITSCQMPTGINQRVFDVPMSGAFILNDHQADLEELFAPEEYATYRSVDELSDKEEYYFRNSNARKAIIVAARLHISANHTYQNRLCTLLGV